MLTYHPRLSSEPKSTQRFQRIMDAPPPPSIEILTTIILDMEALEPGSLIARTSHIPSQESHLKEWQGI